MEYYCTFQFPIVLKQVQLNQLDNADTHLRNCLTTPLRIAESLLRSVGLKVYYSQAILLNVCINQLQYLKNSSSFIFFRMRFYIIWCAIRTGMCFGLCIILYTIGFMDSLFPSSKIIQKYRIFKIGIFNNHFRNKKGLNKY